MNVLTIIQIALFVPFLLMLTIFAVIYLINGYKKDLGRSLISLAATVAATGIGLLLAKLLGWALSGAVASLFSSGLSAETGTLGADFLKGIIEIVLSFLLFVVFFIAGLAVFKTLGKKIRWNKLEALNAGKTGTRLAGMGVRAVDAVLVSIMLLLPLYGTVAMVAPPAAALTQLSESSTVSRMNMSTAQRDSTSAQEISTSDILETVADHPVLIPYKYGPGAWVYSELASFPLNGKTVEISTAVNSFSGMLERIETLQAAVQAEDEQAALAAAEELIDYTRREVINQRWSYNMVMAFVGEIDAMMETAAAELPDDDKLIKMYEQVRPLLDMSFEEYQNNAEGILDFAAWLIEIYGKYGEEALTDADESAVMQELFTRLGELLNHSEQATALKRVILQMFAQELFDILPDGAGSGAGMAFVDKYFGDGVVPEGDRLAEASAFFSLLDSSSALDTAEAFVRHPLFGADAVLESVDESLYIYGGDRYLSEQLAASEDAAEIYKALDDILRSYENAPLGQPLSFGDEATNYLTEKLELSGIDEEFSTTFMLMGEDGKIYFVPEELTDELAGMDTLDEQTIAEYGLTPFGGSLSVSGEDTFVVLTPEFEFSIN